MRIKMKIPDASALFFIPLYVRLYAFLQTIGFLSKLGFSLLLLFLLPHPLVHDIGCRIPLIPLTMQYLTFNQEYLIDKF